MFQSKTRLFNCFVASVFLHSSELRTLTKTKEDIIHSFNHGLLRTAFYSLNNW